MWNKKQLAVVGLALVAGAFLKSYFFPSVKSTDPTDIAAAQTKQAADSRGVRLSGPTMGTTFNFTYAKGEFDQDQQALNRELVAFLQDFNKEFSTYDRTSVISQFNQLQQAYTPFNISDRFAKVMATAYKISSATEGYYDVTVAPLVKAWGFGPGEALPNLTQEQINALKEHVGYDKVKLKQVELPPAPNTQTQTPKVQWQLEKTDPYVTIDLSSIAKGYAVDLVSDIFAAKGSKNYLVEIGGEVYAKGKNPAGNPWTIAIEQPNYDGSASINTIIEIDGKAVATSGDYRNFRLENGKRITHEIDPFTGRSITHNLASLTVVNDDTMTADGLSTALYVMGPERALAFAEAHKLGILMITFEDGQFKTTMSSEFSKLVKVVDAKKK